MDAKLGLLVLVLIGNSMGQLSENATDSNEIAASQDAILNTITRVETNLAELKSQLAQMENNLSGQMDKNRRSGVNQDDGNNLADKPLDLENPEEIAVRNIISEFVISFKNGSFKEARHKWDALTKLGSLLKLAPNDELYNRVFKSILYQIYGHRSAMETLDFVMHAMPVVDQQEGAQLLVQLMKMGLDENADRLRLLFYLDHIIKNNLDGNMTSEDQNITKVLMDKLHYNLTKDFFNSDVCIHDYDSGRYMYGLPEPSDHDNVFTWRRKDMTKPMAWRFDSQDGGLSYVIKNSKEDGYLYVEDPTNAYYSDKIRIHKTMDKSRMDTKWKVNFNSDVKRFSVYTLPMECMDGRMGKAITLDHQIVATFIPSPNNDPRKIYNWVIEKCD